MTLTQKIHELIGHFSEENFYLAQNVLDDTSGAPKVTWDMVVAEGEHTGKTVLQASFNAWQAKRKNNTASVNPISGICQKAVIKPIRTQFFNTGAEESLVMLCMLYHNRLLISPFISKDDKLPTSCLMSESEEWFMFNLLLNDNKLFLHKVILTLTIQLMEEQDDEQVLAAVTLLFHKRWLNSNNINDPLEPKDQNTLLHYAAYYGHPKTVTFLVRQVASLPLLDQVAYYDAYNAQHYNPLNLAFFRLKNDQTIDSQKLTSIVRCVEILGANHVVWGHLNLTALHTAVQWKLTPELFQVFLASPHCDLNAKYNQQGTAFDWLLQWATEKEDRFEEEMLPIIKLFFEHPQMDGKKCGFSSNLVWSEAAVEAARAAESLGQMAVRWGHGVALGLFLNRDDAERAMKIKNIYSHPSFVQASNTMLAIIELVSDTKLLYDHTKKILIESFMSDMGYFQRAFQNRLAVLPERQLSNVLQKVKSLMNPNQAESLAIALSIVDWMELDKRFPIALTRIGSQYTINNAASAESLHCATAIQSQSQAGIEEEASADTEEQTNINTKELRRQLSEILAYRLRCHIEKASAGFFSSFGGEKRFYTDHLEIWLPEIVFYLHHEHNRSATAHNQDFSWLKKILHSALDKPLVGNSGILGEIGTLRATISGKQCNVHDMAVKLSAELGGNDETLRIKFVEIFTNILSNVDAQDRISSTTKQTSSVVSKTLLQQVVATGTLTEVLPLIGDRKISTLTKEEQKDLLEESQAQLIKTGSEIALEILCRFHEDGVFFAAEEELYNFALDQEKGYLATQQIESKETSHSNGTASTLLNMSKNSINAKVMSQNTLQTWVFQYLMYAPNSEENAIRLFEKLSEKGMRQWNQRFNASSKPTLLHVALYFGYEKIVDALLVRGIEPDWLNGNSLTAVQSALVRLTSDKTLKKDENTRGKIIRSLEKILDYSPKVWAETATQPALLHFAIDFHCSAELFEVLLRSRHCNPMQIHKGDAPLVRLLGPASKKNSSRVLSILKLFLIHPKVDPYYEDKSLTDELGRKGSVWDSAASYKWSEAICTVIMLAHNVILLCSEYGVIDREAKAGLTYYYKQYAPADYEKTLFKNRFAALPARLLGVVVQKIQKLDLPIMMNMVGVDAKKWSIALSNAGEHYVNSKKDQDALSIQCANEMQSHQPASDLIGLQRQLQVALVYRLRCYVAQRQNSHLPAYANSTEKVFFTKYLASLLPQITAFIQKEYGNATWLNALVANSLNQVVNASGPQTLREAIVSKNSGPLMREKLRVEFCPEIVEVFTRELNVPMSEPQPHIDVNDKDTVGMQIEQLKTNSRWSVPWSSNT